jgi:hypothetical protein
MPLPSNRSGETYAKLAQRGHLVVHQRDQRRNDHRGARPAQRGNLKADALAAAGRHQHQRVATGDYVVYHLLLVAPESREAEHPTQHCRRIFGQQRLQHRLSSG